MGYDGQAGSHVTGFGAPLSDAAAAAAAPTTPAQPPAATSTPSPSRTTAKSRATNKPKPPAATTPPDRRDEKGQGPDRRYNRADRRSGLERRQQTRDESGYTGAERRSGKERRDTTGLERRRGPGRRRSDERRSAAEGEMNTAQFEFVMAIETYKKVNKRLYPTWTEILEIVRQLGYRKVLPREITLNAPETAVFSGKDPEPEYDPGADDDADDMLDDEQ